MKLCQALSWLLIPIAWTCLGCTPRGTAPSLPEPSAEDGDLVAVSLDVLPPGVYPQQLQREDGTLLRYTISVPPGYSREAGAPLILALHFGGGGRGRGQPVSPYYGGSMLGILVKPALQQLNAIIVAPDSIAGRWNNETNEAAVLQIMDEVIAKYNVDQRKVLVTGFSMGGAGTWYMAGRHPERFSAAIPIAARPVEADEWKIPLYVIHSRDDELIPLARAEAYVQALQAQDVDVQLVVVDGVKHHQTDRFAEPLRQAIPWIRKIWNEREQSQDDGA